MEKVDVIASFDWMDKEEKVGTLGHEYLRGSDVFSFEFDKNWLKTFPKIDFGQDLRPYTGVQYSRDNHIFGCFSDALPDRWGRRLIDLRTSLETEGKSSHTLSDWDYLKGVEDELRVGGFRFKDPDSGAFISSTPGYSVPPAIHIDELLQAAKEIEKSEYKHLEPEKNGYKGFSSLVPRWVAHVQRLVCRVTVIFILQNSLPSMTTLTCHAGNISLI